MTQLVSSGTLHLHEESLSAEEPKSRGIKESTARIFNREKDTQLCGTVQCEAHRRPPKA